MVTNNDYVLVNIFSTNCNDAMVVKNEVDNVFKESKHFLLNSDTKADQEYCDRLKEERYISRKKLKRYNGTTKKKKLMNEDEIIGLKMQISQLNFQIKLAERIRDIPIDDEKNNAMVKGEFDDFGYGTHFVFIYSGKYPVFEKIERYAEKEIIKPLRSRLSTISEMFQVNIQFYHLLYDTTPQHCFTTIHDFCISHPYCNTETNKRGLSYEHKESRFKTLRAYAHPFNIGTEFKVKDSPVVFRKTRVCDVNDSNNVCVDNNGFIFIFLTTPRANETSIVYIDKSLSFNQYDYRAIRVDSTKQIFETNINLENLFNVYNVNTRIFDGNFDYYMDMLMDIYSKNSTPQSIKFKKMELFEEWLKGECEHIQKAIDRLDNDGMVNLRTIEF